MRLDVTTLMDFYDTPLGQMAAQMLADRLDALWPSVTGLDVLGIGYVAPFMDEMKDTSRRSICAMPGGQGGHAWSCSDRGSASVLVNEHRLPFPDAMFDRVVVAHTLEETYDHANFLREVWRVTAPEGRVILMASNRAGLWCRTEGTPFGHGRPFSRRQLTRLMQNAVFQPTAWSHALYMPPMDWRLVTASAEAWERSGALFLKRMGGVVLVEGVKRLQIDPLVRRPPKILSLPAVIKPKAMG